MKKLLGLLGVVSITASATTTVIACNSAAKDAEATNAALLSEYSKALYVSQKGTSDKHVSSSYIFTDIIGANEASTLAISTDKKTVADVINANFDTTNLTSNVTIKGTAYLGGTISLDSPVEGMLQTVIEYAPMVLDALSNPEKIAGLAGIIPQLLSADILAQLVQGLSADNAQILVNAFSNDIYTDMTFGQAINSSIIGLANGVSYLNDASPKIFAYDTAGSVEANYANALNALVKNILSPAATTPVQVSVKNQVAGVAEIIRFVRTLAIYLNSFSESELTGSVLSQNSIQAKRDAKVTSNSFDLKKFINVISYMVKTDSNGTVLKNLIGSLFATTKVEPNWTEKVSFTEGGYIDILDGVALGYLGAESMPLPSPINQTIYYSSVVRGAINFVSMGEYDGSIGTLLGFIPMAKDSLPEFLGVLIDKIGDDWKKFSEDPIGYLWSNTNTDLNISIKGMLDKPLSDVFSLLQSFIGTSEKFDNTSSSLLDFFMSKSLVELSDLLTASIGDNTSATIDFDKITAVVKPLTDQEMLKKLQEDPSKLMTLLGLSEDGKSFTEGSVLKGIQDLVASMPWLTNVITALQTLVKDYTTKLSKYRAEVVNQLKNVSVETNSTSAATYKYTVTEGSTKKTYTISISGKTGSQVISAIEFN